jgi:anthranilate synthase component 1
MTFAPDFDAFAEAYQAGRPQVVWTRLIDDLETPVSAYLKIARGEPYAFLFESVEGGSWRGRYSIVAMRPDLVWRCRGDVAEIARGAAIERAEFARQPGGALDSLRDLVARTRLELPAGLPPMAAGLFGVLGYDMVRLVERLPDVKADPLGLPDAILIRPSMVAIFDAIAQEIILVTTARPSERGAAFDYDAARARLEAVAGRLAEPLARTGAPPGTERS